MTKKKLSIQCIGLHKSYHRNGINSPVLTNLNLEINHGEFLMLVGPSGSGKTTLISIIAGILSQDSGECIVENFNYRNFSSDELIEFRGKNIGFIFQSLYLIPNLSVIENIVIPLVINGMPYQQAQTKGKALIETLNLQSLCHLPVKLLSGGQQQKVAIARAVIHQPKILICDEPTSSLDFQNGTQIFELMRQINENTKTTFIVVTHDSRMYKYADRLAYMENGHIKNVNY